MIALCRLAERQGLLKGDLNSMQQRALEVCMIDERKELIERDEMKIKNAWIIQHPDKAQKIEAAFAKTDPDAQLSAPEDDYHDTDEDTKQVLADLASRGFAFTDSP